jgi:hypothetical protein
MPLVTRGQEPLLIESNSWRIAQISNFNLIIPDGKIAYLFYSVRTKKMSSGNINTYAGYIFPYTNTAGKTQKNTQAAT